MCRLLFSLACLLGLAFAQSAVRLPVAFSVIHDAGFGNEVCVLGSHPDLGGGDPLRAPKLSWTPGNVWTGRVALAAGATLDARFIRRDFSVGQWPLAANAVPVGDAFAVQVPDHPAPPWLVKTILYRSAWAAPRLLYRDLTSGGAWTDVAMAAFAPGRVPGEQTFRAVGLAPGGHELEFVFHDGGGQFDNAPSPPSNAAQGAAPAVPVPYQGLTAPYNYRCSLDVFLVQDGQVFQDDPPANPGPPRFETRDIASTVAGIPGRPITILLPRGYDQHTSKRYPVVYFHDGQNVFFPGGPFGTWDADRIARHETAMGRMRESILVAIPNGNAYGSDRLREYLPDGETIVYLGATHTGAASAYARFLLENVLPTLDAHYRTLGGAADTFVIGSSMGGLASDYISHRHPERFGGAGIFSPAYWAAPLWTDARDADAKRPVRRYLYMGTAESSSGESSSQVYWAGALRAHDAWTRQGHVLGDEFRFEGGPGAPHSEGAWSFRLPAAFQHLLDPRREAPTLALTLHPPRLRLESLDASGARFRSTTFHGVGMDLAFGNVLPTPSAYQPWERTSALWQESLLDLPAPADELGFWSLRLRFWPFTPPVP